MIVVERLKGEIQRRRIPPNQTGFRKRMGNIDDTYVLNYLVTKLLGKRGRLIVLFVNLKAAF